jgi:hypothetical protein
MGGVGSGDLLRRVCRHGRDGELQVCFSVVDVGVALDDAGTLPLPFLRVA